MQLVMQASIKAAIHKQVPLVKNVMVDATPPSDSHRARHATKGNTPPPDSHRARHVVLGGMPQVQLQPRARTAVQANIRQVIQLLHIPARSVLLGNLLSTHNPLAPTVPLENTRHQVIQQVRRARTVPRDTRS